MTSRILHLINSSYFSMPEKVTSPEKAVLLLGLNTIKALVFYVKIFYSAPDFIYPGLTVEDMWSESSKIASLSKSIATSLSSKKSEQEDAFLSGMLSGIGKILLIEHPSYFAQVLDYLEANEEIEFSEAEYLIHNTSSAEVGAYLLGLWGMSDSVVEAVALHNKPELYQFDYSVPIIATYLAKKIVSESEIELEMINKKIASNPKVARQFTNWKNILNNN